MTTSQTSISKWALHRRLYNWVLSFAHHRHASLALFLMSGAESSFFPIAPDFLQIALTLEHRHRAYKYALINTVGSVLGGLLGYLIGHLVWQQVNSFFFAYVFSEQTFANVDALYTQWNFWIVFIAAFTPIPYKVITIAAGVFGISLPLFLIASIIGRGLRFFILAFLLSTFGPSIKKFIERYFNLLTLAVMLVLGFGFFVLKYL